jgi:7-cyano-7-deazaguanine synthase
LSATPTSERFSKRAVVLLSSGLDSTVNLYLAKESAHVVLALTFDYGQRAARREIERAALIAQKAGVAHTVIDLKWFAQFTQTSLVNRAATVPTKDSVSIADLRVSQSTAKAVWVPNRNGIFLNIAAGFAEGLLAHWIVPGFNKEEAATFPDNSDAFLKAATASFRFSTANHIEAVCFTTELDKTQIVQKGRALGAPFDLMWPCYFDGAEPCGECESCQRFRRATQQG